MNCVENILKCLRNVEECTFPTGIMKLMFLFTFVLAAVRFPVGIWTEHCAGDVGASDLNCFKIKGIVDKQREPENFGLGGRLLDSSFNFK